MYGLVVIIKLYKFQSTSPRRRRLTVVPIIDHCFLFQSTSPRRRRLLQVLSLAVMSDFNPRLHEGDDFSVVLCHYAILYFNPRLHEGDDVIGLVNGILISISIHVSTKETTQI